MKNLLFLLFATLGAINISHANDVNGDSNVNISDVIATINMVLNPSTASAAADCTSPEGVDINDVICIINIVLGNGGGISQADAARFLNQATFGATLNDINALTSSNYETWLNQQFNLPAPAFFVDELAASWLNTCRRDGDNGTGNLYTNIDQFVDTWVPEELSSAAWWNAILNKEDQLRQRVAFALSEILVVSGRGPLSDSDFGLADYYDLLYTNAFGNYRDLLEKVTLHPIMGRYLSMVQNEKANPAENIRPDENYAREILQLFSIGVHELNLDGTLKMQNGQPIPTYDQDVIEGFAQVFTGWNFANTDPSVPWTWDLWIGDGLTRMPMIPWEDYHDTTEKQLLNTTLPANQTAQADLTAALDNIFAHPNIAPFISKQLIQRLVTSNPTPAYVARVAQKFNNNGVGVKGDLQAVVKAILLDDEARNGHATVPNFGKLREPLLRLSHLRRVFGTEPITQTGTFWQREECGQGSYSFYPMPIDSTLSAFGQELLEAPSVFNFFLPTYSPAGPVGNAGLVAPEFQIVTENTMTQLSNEIVNEVLSQDWDNYDYISVDTSHEETLVANVGPFLDHLNLLLLNGDMSPDLRTLLRDYLNNTPFYDNDVDEKQAYQARDAILLILHSPDYLIQK
jgi:uncharacterized protein (DUF1800 family)